MSTATTTDPGRAIRTAIRERGTSPFAVAKAAGIPHTTFYRKLDKPGTFTVEELGDIAHEALGMTLSQLLKEGAR